MPTTIYLNALKALSFTFLLEKKVYKELRTWVFRLLSYMCLVLMLHKNRSRPLVTLTLATQKNCES